MSDRFAAYYDGTAGRPPRRTLLAALGHFGNFAGMAVDLGCGDGRDAIELLRRGWSVLAIDAEPEAIARLEARPDLPRQRVLETRIARFEATHWPEADLVNASFALPLVPPDAFAMLWHAVLASLKPGGRFAGQFFGDRDDWAGRPGITFHRRAEAERLLSDLAVELFDEEESDAVTPRGASKHWHIFHICARRR